MLGPSASNAAKVGDRNKVLRAEKALKDTKEQIKALRREARQATTLEAQHEI